MKPQKEHRATQCLRPLLSALLCWVWAVPHVFANPERLSVQSALVWRADGTGDDLLPSLADNTSYILPKAIPTAGQIASMTASWTFEGQVTLDVSADDGGHYTPVVNGVPLASGFVNGNRLKWRARLGPASRLTELRMAYTDSSGVVSTFGQPALAGFRYRKSIAINGSASGELFNHQMKLAIGESAGSGSVDAHGEGRIRSDFADLRFTAADGETLLAHYLERLTGTPPNQVATVWVKIPHLPPKDVLIYLYYGNASAMSLSDGRAVFDFFDDFAATRLDPALWEARTEAQGRASVSGSALQLERASILSTSFEAREGVVVEYIATAKTARDDARLLVHSDRRAARPEETGHVAYASAYPDAEHCLAVGNIVKANDNKPIAAGTAYGYRLLIQDTTLVFERYDEAFAKRQAIVSFNDQSGPAAGSLGLRSEGAASYDWIRVRKAAAALPEVDRLRLAVEEVVDLPLFTNTTLAPNGNLALAKGSLEGSYVSTAIRTPFATRILVPQWKGDAASVDLSANGGLSYKLASQPGVSYYASKGDFAVGNLLRYRLSLRRIDPYASPTLESMALDYQPGAITLVSPNGGEQLVSGKLREIVWSALGYERTYPLRLEYSLDGGKTYTYQLIADKTPNDGTHPWDIPQGVASPQALVHVSDWYDPTVSDASDKPFMILASSAPIPLQAAASVSATQQTVQPSQAVAQPTQEVAQPTDLASLLEELGTDPAATPQELLITITGSPEADPNKQALSYEAGDVVLIRPAGGEWSETEKASFLIIQANLTPEAVEMLMSPLEVPTGEVDQSGEPVMEMAERRKFQVDVEGFDLSEQPGDRGKPAVLRHFREPHDLTQLVVEQTADGQDVPATLSK